MSSGKSIITELVKVVCTVGVTLVLTSWYTGLSDIEYKSRTINSYFNIPDALENKLKIMNGTTEIEDISVVNFGLYNRGFSDYENVKLDIEIHGKPRPKILSASLVPPERLASTGIKEIRNSNNELTGYSVNVFKTSVDDDYYLIHLIFEGSEAPKVEVKTSSKNIEVVKYKEWKDTALIVLLVSVVYAAVLIPFFIIMDYSGKRHKNRFLNILKEKWSEGEALTKEQLTFVVDTFVEERDRKKDSALTRLKKKITSTE